MEQLKLDIQVKNKLSDKLIGQLGDWTCLYSFFESAEWPKIKNALRGDVDKITPDVDNWFRAFTACKYSELRVVFLGLCPYHTRDGYTKELVADGLCFSTATKHNVPPSLYQFYKGMEWDLWDGINLKMDRTNKLDYLAEQGILMANAALTTIEGKASHHNDIWAPFTRFLIETLNKEKKDIIFVGFGEVANRALLKVDRTVHTVIELEHPAAAAYNFRNWKHEKVFSRIDEFLDNKQKGIILWDKYLVDTDCPF